MVKYHANNDNDNRGVPRIWQGGGPRFFFSDLEILHVAKRHHAYGEAMRFARGVWEHAPGIAPPRIFFKWYNLVRFGVYLDPILSLNFFLNYHFLCNFF